MPTRTEMPKRHGERVVVSNLDAMGGDDLHIWANVEYIPDVRDNDVVLWHKRAGCFIVEVKGVEMSSLERFGYRDCKIRGRAWEHGPQYQAQLAMIGLKRYVQRWFTRTPFVVATACWPLISRAEWNKRWDDRRVTGEYSERMIFREDLYAGPDALRRRLSHIWKHPPVREGSKSDFRHDDALLEQFHEALVFNAAQKPTASERKKFLHLESEASRSAAADVPADRSSRLVYTGLPGTGKTFRLLRIAAEHAMAGKRVLFACYNKVLAAECRRLFSKWKEGPQGDAVLDIRDVFEVISEMAAQEGLEWFGNPDIRAREILGELKGKFSGGIYDTILVDEAQDLPGWSVEMLLWLGVPDLSLCIAEGRGQELYGERSAELEALVSGIRAKKLRRNFRNTRPGFQFSQLAYESRLRRERLLTACRTVFPSRQEEQQLEFDREDGGGVELHYFKDSIHAELGSSLYEQERSATMVGAYRDLISSHLDELGEGEWPLDLLVLVPQPHGLHRDWAVEAMRSLESDRVRCLDYTDDCNRRQSPQPSDVRVATFHSARGIEANRVLVLGFEDVVDVASGVSARPENLAYIVLSRAIVQTTIAVPSSVKGHRLSQLLVAIREAVDTKGRSAEEQSPAEYLTPDEAFGAELEDESEVESTAQGAPQLPPPQKASVSVSGTSLSNDSEILRSPWPTRWADKQSKAPEVQLSTEEKARRRKEAEERALNAVRGTRPRGKTVRRSQGSVPPSHPAQGASPPVDDVTPDQVFALIEMFRGNPLVWSAVHGDGKVRRVLPKVGHVELVVRFGKTDVTLTLPGDPLQLRER